MKYYLFIDETGDHGLTYIDQSFPIFMIAGILISEVEYLKLNSKLNFFKREFFNTDEVILHSNDIRRIKEPFQILFDLKLKENFYKKLNKIITEVDYKIIPAAIMKTEYVKKYGKATKDPYSLSFSFILERLIFDCDEIKNCSEIEIIIEKRGKKEDSYLESALQKTISNGTYYVVPERFGRLISCINFKSKKENDNGLQLADLVAYPIARYILNDKEPNPVFFLINNKIRKNGDIKIFP